MFTNTVGLHFLLLRAYQTIYIYIKYHLLIVSSKHKLLAAIQINKYVDNTDLAIFMQRFEVKNFHSIIVRLKEGGESDIRNYLIFVKSEL